MITRLWWLLRGYGSTKDKLLFVVTLVTLGIFILFVYIVCQMVQGVQELSTEAPPLSEDENDLIGIDGLNEDKDAMTNSAQHGY